MGLAIGLADDSALLKVAEEDHLGHERLGLRPAQAVPDKRLHDLAKVCQQALVDARIGREPVGQPVLDEARLDFIGRPGSPARDVATRQRVRLRLTVDNRIGC